MDKTPNNAGAVQQPPRQHLTLAQYVHRRNGVPLGHASSLRNMLYRSFGAGSFAKFWQYWNPIWGYGLGKFVYAPLQRYFPSALALLLTFVTSGIIHDLVTMAIRRSITFFFTPWFFLLGLGVLAGRFAKMNVSSYPWWFRAGINLLYLSTGVWFTILIKQVTQIP